MCALNLIIAIYGVNYKNMFSHYMLAQEYDKILTIRLDT
jgi:hypothetical protein